MEPESAVATWATLLDDLPDEALVRAATHYASQTTSPWWPNPGLLRQIAKRTAPTPGRHELTGTYEDELPEWEELAIEEAAQWWSDLADQDNDDPDALWEWAKRRVLELIAARTTARETSE